jgi:hypothetical protein
MTNRPRCRRTPEVPPLEVAGGGGPETGDGAVVLTADWITRPGGAEAIWAAEAAQIEGASQVPLDEEWVDETGERPVAYEWLVETAVNRATGERYEIEFLICCDPDSPDQDYCHMIGELRIRPVASP